ncbi:MAG: toll/interleukin-1 receptor domain-containing protein [Myxococcota bacterium]
MNIFVSHTHVDRPIVDALRGLLKELFDERVELRYSSSSTRGEGVGPGDAWLSWIQGQVRDSDLTFVLLTAESVRKPWLLWETGAVTGVSLANASPGAEDMERRFAVVPILVGIQIEQIPSPLRSLHAVYGDSEAIKPLVEMINERLGFVVPARFMPDVFPPKVASYLEKLKEVLSERPLPLSEPAVAEWLDRLDDLRAQKRSAEVGHYHRAILRAFTSETNRDALLDLRLHRRLGEMYMDGNQPERAVDELRKAFTLSNDKDLFILHKLGLAYLQAQRLDDASQIIADIERLDPQAGTTNPEIAGLLGRFYRDRWKRNGFQDDLVRARDAYAAALEASERVGQRSYYMADNVGQLCLLLGETQQALAAFEKSREFIDKGHEQSLWAYASLASACFAVNDQQRGFAAIERLRAMEPDSWVLESITGGLERIRDGLAIEATTYERWRSRLHGQVHH